MFSDASNMGSDYRFDPIGEGATLRRVGCPDRRYMQTPVTQCYPIKFISRKAAHQSLQPPSSSAAFYAKRRLLVAGRPRSAAT